MSIFYATGCILRVLPSAQKLTWCFPGDELLSQQVHAYINSDWRWPHWVLQFFRTKFWPGRIILYIMHAPAHDPSHPVISPQCSQAHMHNGCRGDQVPPVNMRLTYLLILIIRSCFHRTPTICNTENLCMLLAYIFSLMSKYWLISTMSTSCEYWKNLIKTSVFIKISCVHSTTATLSTT